VLSSTLIWDQVLQVCEPRQKRLLASPRMMEPLYRKQFPLDGVMGLVSQRAGHRHPGVFKDDIPAGLLVSKPVPHPLAIGDPSRGGDVVDTIASPLAQRKHPQALPLARPVPQGVQLRA
jgi:hypothetical protein